MDVMCTASYPVAHLAGNTIPAEPYRVKLRRPIGLSFSGPSKSVSFGSFSPMAIGSNASEDTDDIYGDLFKINGKVVYMRNDQKSPIAEVDDDAESLAYKPEFRSPTILPSKKTLLHRRHVLVCGGASLVTILTLNWPLTSSPAWAAEATTSQEDKDETVVDAIKSLFDPDEKTKSRKVLPKAYLKSAREVVKTLRESVNEDPKDNAKFRRTADAAKASIRDYLGNWRGNQIVFKEESYVMLEKAIRSLASFYSKAGPSAALPEEVKSDILYDLNTAEEFL